MYEAWNEIQDRMMDGDPLAFGELSRLITSVLRQEVSWAVIENAKRVLACYPLQIPEL